MDQLWISLPWPQPGTWPPYESGTVGGALRLANCLRVAAGKAGWGSKRLPPNTAMGLAVSSAEERQSPTWVAGVAEVTVDPATGKSAKVDLIPLDGPASGGSQVSLPALQLLGVSLTDLPTIEVYRS